MEACPKCNFSLAPQTVECPACGVILSKLKAPLTRQIPLMSPPASPRRLSTVSAYLIFIAFLLVLGGLGALASQ